MRDTNDERMIDAANHDDNDDDDEPYHFVQVGQSLIRVGDEQFERGYQHGYEDFRGWWAKQRLTDGKLYILLSMSITCPALPHRENAGYIVGWVAALLEYKSAQEDVKRSTEQTHQRESADGSHEQDIQATNQEEHA